MSEKLFHCTCSASFSRKYNLERHQELTHGVKKEAKIKIKLLCFICNKVCSNKRSLDKHHKQHHLESLENLSQPLVNRGEREDADTQKFSILQDHLPKGYNYEISEFNHLQKGFKCNINFGIDTMEEATKFLKEFKLINSTRYLAAGSRSTADILLEKRFNCHHHSRKNCPSKKNTNCPAKLVMVITKGTLENKLVCNVKIYNEHNHEKKIYNEHNYETKIYDALNHETNIASLFNSVSQEKVPSVSSEEKKEVRTETNQNVDLLNEAKEIFSNITQRMENNLPAFQNAIEAFKKQYKEMHKDAALVSALHCFGKFNGFSAERRNASSYKIGVQSTAIARRKTACGGRRAVCSGRPAGWSNTPEHGYSVQK